MYEIIFSRSTLTFFLKPLFKKIFLKSHFEDLFLKISLIKTFCYIVEQFSYCSFGFTIPKGIARKLNFLELPLFPHIQRLTLPLWVRGPFHLLNFTTLYHFLFTKINATIVTSYTIFATFWKSFMATFAIANLK